MSRRSLSTGTKEIKMADAALERLREAESFIGSSYSELFSDRLGLEPQPRQIWLDSVRDILRANGIKPENLTGPWQTIPGRKELIEHIKEHLPEFQALTGRETVEEYFDEYWSKYPNGEIYERLCWDLNLKPRRRLPK